MNSPTPETDDFPASVANETVLEELLSRPTYAAVESFQQISGDVILLGAGGKMGLSLARMAKRTAEQAGDNRKIIAVSRFSHPRADEPFHELEIETIRGDLLDELFVQSLPDVPNVIHMTGMKFGTSTSPALTWATNVIAPASVCRKYYDSRIVAFSTGNVYPLVPVENGGSLENDRLEPAGEYANAAVGRERVFQYFSETRGTKIALIRLNYAVDLRYGVLVDVAQKVWNEEPIDLTMGFVNVIWQGDANAMALAALRDTQSPAFAVNVTGSECLSIREVASQLGALMSKQPQVVGSEASNALLSNSNKAVQRYGPLQVETNRLLNWIAAWTISGGRLLGKPTHFEVRDGKF